MKGNASMNTLTGNSAAETIYGYGGADKLNGEAGNDVLVGGSGKDAFVFDTAPNKSTNIDKISDFSVADDTIHVQNSVFKEVGLWGKMASSSFWTGAKAHNSSDRIIYDNVSGNLYYDPDGTGAASAVQFSELAPNLKMTAV